MNSEKQNRELKLGTRWSLLARAQSGWVAREIERLNPDVKVTLVRIETRGDRIVDIPLREVAGKEFFVAELDDALKSGSVDLTVHSMKDLSLERPAEFALAAVPKRENPRDAVLFGPGVMEKIRAGKTLRIGTSAPRRLENIPAFLARALPVIAGKKPKVEFVEIRGNVNTRLSRVHEPEGSERALDAVVLAFAGLNRLWSDAEGRAELKMLLEGVRWMVLPLTDSPAAPAQGALAIECRGKEIATLEMIRKLHDPETAEAVARERGVLVESGGGCHQKFGATCASYPEIGPVLFIRGRMPDDVPLDEMHWNKPEGERTGRAWDGTEHGTQGFEPTELASDDRDRILGAGAIFAAHSRALLALSPEGQCKVAAKRIWVSGTGSWFKLAEKGFWIEGCAESMGFDSLVPTLQAEVLRLAPSSEWAVLTHTDAADDWVWGRGIATYDIASDAAPVDFAGIQHFYWSSGSQFDRLRAFLPRSGDFVHACGPGKTARHLRSHGIEPKVFPSAEEWRIWLKN